MGSSTLRAGSISMIGSGSPNGFSDVANGFCAPTSGLLGLVSGEVGVGIADSVGLTSAGLGSVGLDSTSGDVAFLRSFRHRTNAAPAASANPARKESRVLPFISGQSFLYILSFVFKNHSEIIEFFDPVIKPP